MNNNENIKRIKDIRNDFIGEFKDNIIYGYCRKCQGLQPMAKFEDGVFYIFLEKRWIAVVES
jgi:hypothetical protein